MEKIKVFKMNEYDFVVAKTEIEAIKWYENETGLVWEEDTNLINPKEMDLDYKIDLYMIKDDGNYDDKPVQLSIREILFMDSQQPTWTGEPYIFMSTEY